MKSGFIILFLMIVSFTGISQSLEKVSKAIDKGDYKEAKVMIDKIFESPNKASDPESVYFKARVYNGLSADKTLSSQDRYKLKVEAYQAFLKNQELDPKDMRMKLEAYLSYLDLYGGFYDLGVLFFNDKSYDEAFNSFLKSYEVESYITTKGYTFEQAKFPPVDTALVMNIGLSAQLAKNEKEAAKYYQKLVDANVSGKQYEAVYESLAVYYEKNGDDEALSKLISKSTKLYPSNNFLNEFSLRLMEKKGGKEAVYAKYDDMIKNDPTNFPLIYNYAIDLYNSLYVGDNKPANIEAAQNKLKEVLKLGIQNDKGIDATVLMSNHLYNAASDYFIEASEIKGNKPADLKKKKDLNDKAKILMDEAIPYALTALKYFDSLDSMKTSQKATRVNILATLSDIYNAKGDAKKSAEYEKLKSKGL